MTTLQMDDFVVLGRTFPEDSKRYGHRICMAGYSPSANSFVRIYPLLLPVGENANANGFHARRRYAVSLRRNPNDNRVESWHVKDVNNPTSTPWDRAPEVPKAEILRWLDGRTVSSTHCLDACRLSLGVLRFDAHEWDGYFESRDAAGNEQDGAPGLFDDLMEEMGRDHEKVRHAAYIRFRDGENGNDRKLQIREWGAYLGLAHKFHDDPDKLWGAPGYQTGRPLYVIVGNMNTHRNVWLAIKTFQPDMTRAELPGLFDQEND